MHACHDEASSTLSSLHSHCAAIQTLCHPHFQPSASTDPVRPVHSCLRAPRPPSWPREPVYPPEPLSPAAPASPFLPPWCRQSPPPPHSKSHLRSIVPPPPRPRSRSSCPTPRSPGSGRRSRAPVVGREGIAQTPHAPLARPHRGWQPAGF